MFKSRIPRTRRQLELFAARPLIPSWNILPPNVRRQTTALLAKLLWSHRDQGGSGREVTDE